MTLELTVETITNRSIEVKAEEISELKKLAAPIPEALKALSQVVSFRRYNLQSPDYIRCEHGTREDLYGKFDRSVWVTQIRNGDVWIITNGRRNSPFLFEAGMASREAPDRRDMAATFNWWEKENGKVLIFDRNGHFENYRKADESRLTELTKDLLEQHGTVVELIEFV